MNNYLFIGFYSSQKIGKVVHITGNRFDINPEASGLIACDKYATYEILTSQGVPVIEHKMLFNPKTRQKYINMENFWNDLQDYFYKNKKLVVKPNNGCEGQGVSLCTTFNNLKYEINNLFATNNSISLCPFYNIDTEYRVFYLNGECLLTYGKIKPFVIGDGISDVNLLVSKLNLPNTSVSKENLDSLDLNYVPKNEEKVEISWKFNLSGGATPEILKDSPLKNNVEQIAKTAAKALNVSFATVDIIKTIDNNLYVMEINSGICMTNFIDKIPNGYEIAKGIYRKALENIFN